MTQILAVSGRMQAGKTTACNFLFGLSMLGLDIVDYFRISDTGKIIVHTGNGDEAELDMSMSIPQNTSEAGLEYMATNIWPHIKSYSLADTLKLLCINLFGLSWEQMYGSNDDKNSLTEIKWDGLLGVVTTTEPPKDAQLIRGKLGKYYDVCSGLVYHEPGFMTAREVMQFVGTEVFRRMDSDIWVKTLMRQIQAENSAIALVGDVRFPNEVKGIQDVGGKVIRLTRKINDNAHPSECALDAENFDWTKFDAVIDNQNMTIQEQNEAIYSKLREWGWTDQEFKNEEGNVVKA